MTDWKLESYNGRKIETEKDIMWVCKEVTTAYKSGNVELKDQMALCFLERLHQKHINDGCFGFIESRFDILDL